MLNTLVGLAGLTPALLQFEGPGKSIMLISLGAVVLLIIIGMIIANRYVKVPPNTVMVISGGKRQVVRDGDGKLRRLGFRIIKGGGTFVLPVLERVDTLSLELMTIDVKTPEVYTQQGVAIIVDGVAQIKVKGDDISIATAVEQFLNKGIDEIARIAQQTLEGHLRAILGTLTVEDVYKNRDAFAQRVQDVAATDLANMGLSIISFTTRDVRDQQGYLDALGKKRIAEVKRDATIGEAEASRDATIKSAEFRQAGEIAKFEAETKIAMANRDYEMQVANYTKDVNTQKADSDLAYDMQRTQSLRQLREQEVEVEIVEKTKRIELETKEIERKQRELEATIQRPADAKKYEVERLAEAERFRLENIAEGQSRSQKITGLAAAEVTTATGNAEASAVQARGLAEAEVAKQKGLAEAAAVEARGLAEAAGSLEKAKAWLEYNEAAIAQLLIERLPEIARAVSEPMSRIEKIVIIGDGASPGTGASKLTHDITEVIAKLPAIVQALSGMDLNKMIEHLPQIATGGGAADAAGGSGVSSSTGSGSGATPAKH